VNAHFFLKPFYSNSFSMLVKISSLLSPPLGQMMNAFSILLTVMSLWFWVSKYCYNILYILDNILQLDDLII